MKDDRVKFIYKGETYEASDHILAQAWIRELEREERYLRTTRTWLGERNPEAMTRLARTYGSLDHAAGVDPWNTPRFVRWLCRGRSSYATHAGRFLLYVWDSTADWQDYAHQIGVPARALHEVKPFDILNAIVEWDDLHRAAFTHWTTSLCPRAVERLEFTLARQGRRPFPNPPPSHVNSATQEDNLRGVLFRSAVADLTSAAQKVDERLKDLAAALTALASTGWRRTEERARATARNELLHAHQALAGFTTIWVRMQADYPWLRAEHYPPRVLSIPLELEAADWILRRARRKGSHNQYTGPVRAWIHRRDRLPTLAGMIPEICGIEKPRLPLTPPC